MTQQIIMKVIRNISGLLILMLVGVGVNAQSPNCTVAPIPRLVVGKQAQVTPGLPNNVRSGAGIQNNRIGQLPAGAVFDVLDGPVCSGYYYWWQISYRGLAGWTAEGILNDYWLEPVDNTNEATQLSLRVDPILREDAGMIVLEPETFAIIMVSSMPDQANAVEFYFTPNNGGQPFLIGSDVNMRDGGILSWWVEPFADGYLSAIVFNASRSVIAETDTLKIAANVTNTLQTRDHSILGFQIDVLPMWQVELTPTSMILSQGTIEITITTAPPRGLPAGNRITFTDFSNVTGIDLRRDNLIYENRTKGAYYTYQGLDAIPIAGLTLYASVMDLQSDYSSINFTEDMLGAVDQMIATLRTG